MFRVTIGSCRWNCAYSFADKSRMVAFRKTMGAVLQIPDETLRPSESTMREAYKSLADWDKRSRHVSPRMTHEDGFRTWYMDLERIA